MLEGLLFDHIHVPSPAVQIRSVPRQRSRSSIILHIKDLSNVLQHCKLKLYADGMKMYTIFKPNL